MSDASNLNAVGHFLESAYDFNVILDNLKNCAGRGVHIYDEHANDVVFHSYREIFEKSLVCAGRLSKRGLAAGEAVLLSAQTDVHFIVIWLACVWLGLRPATLPNRTAFFLEEIFRTRVREIIPFFGHYICYRNEFPIIEDICAEKGTRANLIAVNELCGNGRDESDDPAFVPRAPAYDDTAFIQFTSGSTSRPRGIVITFRNVFNNLYGIFKRLELDPEQTVSGIWMPLYHDMGLISLLLNVFTQSTIVLVSPIHFMKRMFDFLRMIARYGVNYSNMTNSILEFILHRFSEDKCAGLDLSTLKWVGVGAEPVNPATLEKFYETFKKYGLRENVLSPCYGLAESTLAVTLAGPREGYEKVVRNARAYPTAGRVIDGTEAIVEEEDGCEPGTGIVKIRGESVSSRALVDGREVKTTDDRGFYDTRDVGYFSNGKLVIMGRADNMFIVNGENFFPHEIESLLVDSGLLPRPSVVCIAVALPDSKKGRTEIVVVYEANRINAEEKKNLDEKLAKLIIKSTGLPVDEFIAAKRGSITYTTSGKIKYHAMRKLYLEGRLRNSFE